MRSVVQHRCCSALSSSTSWASSATADLFLPDGTVVVGVQCHSVERLIGTRSLVLDLPAPFLERPPRRSPVDVVVTVGGAVYTFAAQMTEAAGDRLLVRAPDAVYQQGFRDSMRADLADAEHLAFGATHPQTGDPLVGQLRNIGARGSCGVPGSTCHSSGSRSPSR